MAWTTGEILAVVVIVIIFIIIIALLIWFLLVRRREATTSVGEFCSTDADCGSGFYCGGGGICVRGSSGKTQGQTCTADHQCEVGLLCTNGRCITEVPIIPTPLQPSASDFANRVGVSQTPATASFMFDNSDNRFNNCRDDSDSDVDSGCFSFQSKHIVTTASGIRHYLEVTDSGSRWVTFPTQTYDYNCSSKRLSSLGSDIEVANNGNLILSRRSSRLMINRRRNGYVMKDRYGNVLSVTSDGTELDAYFPDPVHYPGSLNNGALPVLFEVM